MDRYAPWALEYITEHAALRVVACRCDEGKLRLLDPNRHGYDMNHWVGAWPIGYDWDFEENYFGDSKDRSFRKH